MQQIEICRLWDMDEGLSIKPDIEKLYKRPRINYRISEYLFNFINERLLKPKKIMQTGHYRVCLSLELCNPDEYKFIKDNPYNTNQTKISSSIRNRTLDKKKYKQTLISGKSLLFTEKITPREYADLIYTMYSAFLIEHFKKATQEELDALKKEIDYTYIESFEYPASFHDQKYLYDEGYIHYKSYGTDGKIEEEIGPFNTEELYIKYFGK